MGETFYCVYNNTEKHVAYLLHFIEYGEIMNRSELRNETYITFIVNTVSKLDPNEQFYYRAGQMLREMKQHNVDISFFMDNDKPEDCWLPDIRMLDSYINSFLEDIRQDIADELREFSNTGIKEAVRFLYETKNQTKALTNSSI